MEITNKDIFKHYICSVIVYGLVLLLLLIAPVFNQDIHNIFFNYYTVLLGLYLIYILCAYPLLNKIRPKSILKSYNVLIINYFKRQLTKNKLEDKLKNITPTEEEKQAFTILFIKAFFSSYCLSLLCNKYLIQLDYDFDFLMAMGRQCTSAFADGNIIHGIYQFLDDTTDMWLTLIFTVTTFVFTISYLTEGKLFRNKINYADTSFLGIFSCLICYYPFTLLAEKIFPIAMKNLIPVENNTLRIIIYICVILVNLFAMIAVISLGTKSGNLTNRGIVTHFPYNIVRHPEYSMRMAFIILTMIPLLAAGNLNILGYIAMTTGTFMWLCVYYFRAITEERNLIKDENYKKYTEKVKYRFIPFVI